jgi:hypothetical protein
MPDLVLPVPGSVERVHGSVHLTVFQFDIVLATHLRRGVTQDALHRQFVCSYLDARGCDAAPEGRGIPQTSTRLE